MRSSVHVASLIDHMAMANGASHRPRRANIAQWAALVALGGAARFWAPSLVGTADYIRIKYV